jgi:predicted membrane protein DUF2207
VTVVPFLLIFWPILIPVAAAFYMFWIAWTRGGDPERDSATVQYDPPDNLTPAECGALLDNAVHPRAITATIADLSVKGYLTIEQNADKPPAAKDDQDYVFHLIKQVADWKDLKPHERAVLSAIFIPTNPLRMLQEGMSQLQNTADGRNAALASTLARLQAITTENPAMRALSAAGSDAQPTAAWSDVRMHFHLHLARIKLSIFEALIAGGYYAGRPDMVRKLWVASGILIGLLLVLMGRFVAATGTSWLLWNLSSILTAMIILGFGWFMPARSVRGSRALAKVRGFMNFLGRVEKDRIERLDKTPQLFEKYLPYAMALGIENNWTRLFVGIATPPSWSQGRDADFFPFPVVNPSAMASQTGRPTTPGEDAASMDDSRPAVGADDSGAAVGGSQGT